jgi:hypothetical protein
MTTNYHTAISVGAAANAATFNTPLGQLDATISTLSTDVAAIDSTVDHAMTGVYNVLEYGATGDGVTDDTTAIQAAITAAAAAKGKVSIPAGKYLVSDTLHLYGGVNLLGETYNYGGVSSYLPNDDLVGGSCILFEPASSKSLFNFTGTKNGEDGSAWVGNHVGNLNLYGNSSPSAYQITQTGYGGGTSSTSLYALDLSNVAYSSFANLAIRGFVAGVYVAGASQMNVFDQIYTNYCQTHGVIYYGSYPTSDTWRNCAFRHHPTGVEHVVEVGDDSESLHIRFVACLFESLDSYGVILNANSRAWEFIGCYAENINCNDAVSGAMFRVGYTGTILPSSNVNVSIIVSGGQYGGPNTPPTPMVTVWMQVDAAWGAIVNGAMVARFLSVFTGTANTVNYGLTVSNLRIQQCTNFYTGTANKLLGMYDETVLNSGTPSTVLDVAKLNCRGAALIDSISAPGTYLSLGKTNEYVVPGADGTVTLGLSNLRWHNVYTEDINATGVLIINGNQVVGDRVIDARCDDTIDSGDATTDGVIDALRDAMITHGLIAAA